MHLEDFKIKCKKEAIGEDGKKIMQFTKGRIYEAVIEFEENTMYFKIKDDKGWNEKFFNLDVMFKRI